MADGGDGFDGCIEVVQRTRGYRRWPDEVKARIVAESFQPGARVADGPRRRHWSDADKIRLVEESHRGHRQVSATARRHGISRGLLTVWRRQYRNGKLSMASGAAFAPVKMALDVDAQPPRQPVPAVQLEIVLNSGRRLLVPSSVEPDALARLLPILEGK